MGRKPKAQPGALVIPGGDEILDVDGVAASKAELIRAGWDAGELSWMLHSAQIEMYAAAERQPPNSIFVEVCARRLGKTFKEMVEVEEFARRSPGSIQLFAAPTKSAASDIVLPVWRKIQATCPEELRAVWRPNTGVWEWPNKAILKLRGTDLELDRLRGAAADRVKVDEAGFHKRLRETVLDVLAPQTDTTQGKISICTTPPNTMDHEFMDFWNDARLDGRLVTKTVFDNPLLSPATLKRICRRANLGYSEEEIDFVLRGTMEGSPTWEREYLCRMVTDKTRRVTPEFSVQKHVYDPAALPLPAYFTAYTFIDLAFVRDYTHALFCVYDFERSKLVIVGEWRGKRKTSAQIASELTQLEKTHFGFKKPMRYADNSNPQQLHDLHQLHGFAVIPTRKDVHKDAMVNVLRTKLAEDRILVHPGCSFLISQLRDGIWDEKDGRPDFERSENMGHLDGVDALVYGVRNVDWRLNPLNAGQVQLYNPSTHFRDPSAPPHGESTVELRRLTRGIYGR